MRLLALSGSLLLSLSLLSAGCAASAPTPAASVADEASLLSDEPAWLRQRMAEALRQPPTNPPTEFWQGQWHGQAVIYQPAVCCDQMSRLWDGQGRLICHPSGGFTGRGDGRCAQAPTDTLQQRLIWRDPRTATR